MASLLDSVSDLLTPDVTSGIGKSTGLDKGMVVKGLAVAAPLVLGAMARRASTPSGLDGLSRLIPQDGGAGLGNLLGMVTGGGAAPAVLAGLFGTGLGAVGGTIDRKLGFKASSLIAMVAPVALGLLAKRKVTEGLNVNTLARTLNDEGQAFLAKGGDTATLVRSALDAGDRATELRTKISPEQWTKIRLAPVAAARLVMLASPSGGIGILKEAKGAADAIDEAKAAADPGSIVGLAFETEQTKEELESLGTDRESNLTAIRDAMKVLVLHSPNEVLGFSKFLHTVGTKVAEASKEGGFLGIGGTRISKEEQAVVDEIDSLTGATA
jgi:hypothetical protein